MDVILKLYRTRSTPTVSMCVVIFTLQAVLIQVFFPIGSDAFSCTAHLKKKQSHMLWQVNVLSKQKSEVLPCTVMLTGPHCQSDRAAHQTSAPTPLSCTEGAENRCQIIWQAKWDIFIRSSTPSQTGANVSWGNTSPLQTSTTKARQTLPLHECFYPGICSFFQFPCEKKRNQPTTKTVHRLVTLTSEHGY